MKKLLLVLFIPLLSYAQKDVTQFLDIPVDGFKPEMIKKLKSKGYTVSTKYEDALEGEFNGKDVYISIGTVNNKVWRVSLLDQNSTDEINIRIRFNTLIQQFQNNDRYITLADSIVSKYTIPEKEDIKYESMVNKKRYDAYFYQKSLKYDSIKNETDLLIRRIMNSSGGDGSGLRNLILRSAKERIKSENKLVWLTIEEKYGKYKIWMFYENRYNEAKGKGL